ncbi:hypothetical protein QYS49_32195 [Marivirga salinae]|uniref:Outer membrane protein beta-barrel domain-containing protein n=1 Tax=Marivirga salinarum TaxID=3059078 RepID=A0AA51REP4_9BACT|nr:hypothetical protein [Marivirga sp. BDSF4-3]WMN12045.1 hypothetical protein QYS49_32195 [Marivirga sp. BDSF4-3]
MNQKLYSTLLIFTFLIVSFEDVNAQNGLKGRNNIKASHSFFRYYGFQNSHFFQSEYNRGVTKFLEVGTYLASHPDFYLYEWVNPPPDAPRFVEGSARAFNYGVQSNFHPLQLFLKEGHRFRLDLYINAKVGGRYSPVPNYSLRQKEHYFFYNIGGGLAYHLYKHWGIFIEYSYRSPAKFRYGLSIKF